MRRVSVVGNAGSGKTRLSQRIAAVLGIPYVELDAIHHHAGWERMDSVTFLSKVDEITRRDEWVIDGNYRLVVTDGPVWLRADTVVWLDVPLRTIMRQVIRRTVRQIIHREELWNGNRQSLPALLAWDSNKSIIRWVWTQHAKYEERFGSAVTSPAYSHITFVHLTNRHESERWLSGLVPTDSCGE